MGRRSYEGTLFHVLFKKLALGLQFEKTGLLTYVMQQTTLLHSLPSNRFFEWSHGTV